MSLHEQVAGNVRAGVRRDARGRYLPGATGNPHGARINQQQLREKFAQLRATYDPDGSLSILDLNRLELAAKHLLFAQKTRNVTLVRSANMAERSLSKLVRPPEAPKPRTIDEIMGR